MGAQSVETRVGTSAVARGALVDVLTRMSITGQLSAEHAVAAATVRAVSVGTNILTGSVSVAQRALVFVDALATVGRQSKAQRTGAEVTARFVGALTLASTIIHQTFIHI